jgi:hypothetical protein
MQFEINNIKKKDNFELQDISDFNDVRYLVPTVYFCVFGLVCSYFDSLSFPRFKNNFNFL